MTKNIGGNCGRKARHGEAQRFPLTYSTCSKGLEVSGILEALEPNPGTEGGSSAIRFRRIRRPNAARQFDIKTLDFRVMDTPTMVTARGGSRPRTDRKLFSFNRQSPTGVELYDVRPTDSDFFQRVGYHDTLITKRDLGANQKNVDANQHKECDKSARQFAGSATLVETRPSKESAENNSKPSEDQVGARAVGLLVIHPAILSHLEADSIKAVS